MILSEELSLIAIQGPKAVKILEKIINGVSNLTGATALPGQENYFGV